MSWEELVKTALLGTDRSTLSKKTLQTLAADGIDTDEENAKIVLQAAAFYGQQRKVGFVLPTFTKALPKAIKETDIRICSYKSSRHLVLILTGQYNLALAEFIKYLTLYKKELPPESLPKLLQEYKNQAEFRAAILPVLGERGRWLIQQNSAWAAFLPFTKIEDWETANKENRLSLIRYLRQTRPEKAVILLQSTWVEESLRDKVAFLKILAVGISKSDEIFLENCLNDKRKGIRVEAALLLAKIADSALVERMYRRVMACFTYEKGLLQIRLPEKLDETAEKDGIYPNLKKYSGGFKASQLGQMMSKIPPQRWTQFFGENASSSLALFMRSSWSMVILEGLIEATLNFPASEWIKAIVIYWMKEEDLDVWQKPILKKFIPIIPTTIFNELIESYLKHRTGLLDEDSAASCLLRAGKQKWSDEVSILWIRNFQNWLNTTNEYYWNTQQYKQLLSVASYQCHPDLYHNLSRDWNFSKRVAQNIQPEVERFLRTLLFRKNMILELKKS